MQRIIAFILLWVLITAASSGQRHVMEQYNAWENPILIQLKAKDPNLVGYGAKVHGLFVNIAILNKTTKELSWVTYTGYVEDKMILSDTAYKRIISHRLDPFLYYQTLLESQLDLIDAAILKFRFPYVVLHYNGVDGYDSEVSALFKQASFWAAKTPLKKLNLLLEERQECAIQLARSRMKDRNLISVDTALVSQINNCHAGTIKASSKTEFYASNAFSPIFKAVLNKKTARLYFYTRKQQIFDSVDVAKKYGDKLVDEKTDVFALYQNLTIWQLSQIDSIAQLLNNYQGSSNIKTVVGTKADKYIQILLDTHKGDVQEIGHSISQLQKGLLYKLYVLNGIDERYYAQYLKRQADLQNPLWTADYIPQNGGTLVMMGLFTEMRGEKRYELNDHRGNVMAVVSDKKIPLDSNNNGVIDGYHPDIIRANDYSSFGSLLPGRTYKMEEYSYGYNGKQNDEETGYQDYGMRMYDPNIGRFLSVDPMTTKFAELSPYQFASNRPIDGKDLDGMEYTPAGRYNGIAVDATAVRMYPLHPAVMQQTNANIVHSQAQAKAAQVLVKQPVLKQADNSFEAQQRSKALKENAAFKKEMDARSASDPVSYGYPGGGQGLARDPFVQTSAGALLGTSPLASLGVGSGFSYLGIENKNPAMMIQGGLMLAGGGMGMAAKVETVTLYRSISKTEANSILNTNQLSFIEGGMEVKQFWQTKEGLDKFNASGFGGDYNLEITIPKSLLGNGKVFNTTTQVDEFFGPSATVDDAVSLKIASTNMQNFKITPKE